MKLVAVQAKMQAKDYADEASFRQKVFNYCEQALENRPSQAIIAFPEAIAAPLLFAKNYKLFEKHNQKQAAFKLLRSNWQSYLSAAIKHRVLAKTIYLQQALQAYRIYENVFAAAAKEFEAIVIAGSGFFPDIDYEVSKGMHIRNKQIFNVCNSYFASGKKTNTVRKVNLMGLEQKLRLSPANINQLIPFRVKNQKIAVAICLDAFYESVISYYDALAATIIVQPSANFASWTRPWPPNNDLTEGEAWLKHGLRQQIQNRENIHFGINPMLVGELFGIELEGQSSIVANTKYYPNANLAGHKGLLAIAKTATKEEVIGYSLKS